jgi:hypothetical protein
MALSHMFLPGGLVAHGYSVVGSPIFTSGKAWYVSSTSSRCQDDPAHGKDPETPFATLDYAIGRVEADGGANRGDVIIVMPNHAETITGAGGITADVAGLTIVGIGNWNQRPRFLMDGATTVTFVVSAADTTVANCVFASGHSNVVTCFNVTAAGFTLISCEFENNAANEDFLTCVKATSTTDNNADGLKVMGCRWVTSDADDLEFIEINATLNRLEVTDNFVHTAGTASPLILVATGKILTGGFIARNQLSNRMTANELFISNDGTTNTGIMSDNYVGHADVTGAHDPGWDGGGWRLFGNLSTSVDNLQGLTIPTTDVNL